MLTFNPPDLLQRLKDAFRVLQTFDFETDWLDFDDEDFDPEEAAGDEITLESLVDFRPPDATEWVKGSVETLLGWSKILSSAKLIDRTILLSDCVTIIHVVPLNDEAHAFHYRKLAESVVAATSCVGEDNQIEVDLVCGLSPFAFALARAGGCDSDYLPSYSDEDLFVEIQHPKGLSEKEASSIAEAYLFELATSHRLEFKPESYPEFGEPDWIDIEDPTGTQILQLRPLDTSRGLPDLYRLYNAGISSQDPEQRISTFSKLIEFVATTAYRLTRHAQVRMRLSSADVLRPDARYLDDLILLVESLPMKHKDAEVIRVALRSFCDSVVLASKAPDCLPKLKKLTEQDEDKTKEAALDELSACLTATRNSLAHAKANYKSVGECPVAELRQFSDCLKVAAQQAIRWYALQPEQIRIS